MDVLDDLKNVIEQIENTSYFINSHTRGHFISEKQLALIKQVLKLDNLDSNIESTKEAEDKKDKLCDDLLLTRHNHSRNKEYLESLFAVTKGGENRRKLNERIQAENSAVAKLDKQLKELFK